MEQIIDRVIQTRLASRAYTIGFDDLLLRAVRARPVLLVDSEAVRDVGDVEVRSALCVTRTREGAHV